MLDIFDFLDGRLEIQYCQIPNRQIPNRQIPNRQIPNLKSKI